MLLNIMQLEVARLIQNNTLHDTLTLPTNFINYYFRQNTTEDPWQEGILDSIKEAHHGMCKFGGTKAPGVMGLLEGSLNKHRREVLEIRKQTLRSQIGFISEDPTLFNNYINAISCSNKKDLDREIIKHWMCNIKKKLLGLPVYYHIMPIYYSRKHGSGKSISVDKLCAPLQGFYKRISFDAINDERRTRVFSENFVLLFDELQGAQRTDINKLKFMVTAPTVTYRPMKTNDNVEIPNLSSFIGTTNEPVEEQIKDKTGMRRFWQIDCPDRLDWNLINSIDYIRLWQSIDESLPNGYMTEEILNQINEVQMELKEPDDIESFLNDSGIKPSPPNHTDTVCVLCSTLFEDWKLYSDNNKCYNQFSKQVFGKKLKKFGIVSQLRKVNNCNVKVYNVHKDCGMDDILKTTMGEITRPTVINVFDAVALNDEIIN